MRLSPTLALTTALGGMLLAGCAAPGVTLHPTDEDFAFLEVSLRG